MQKPMYVRPSGKTRRTPMTQQATVARDRLPRTATRFIEDGRYYKTYIGDQPGVARVVDGPEFFSL